ncbi:MAG: DUF882 domain-containing protein [Mesorhizobium sp.]|nr:DUF882 domain-containing protein [Mesorhizobium sp.]
MERLRHGPHSKANAWPKWLAAAALALGLIAATAGAASAETRSLKLYHLHTHEKAEIVYKRNGRYLPDGLKKINYILRDWRRNETVKMDPRLLDLVWEAYRESGSTGYIQVICGYRAPATNSMLRSRSRGVAEKSQHVLGKAMDFFIPGVPLKKLRDIGLKMQGGGVGYYPTSGSPFVHMDVGNVRHWPGISRQELARVFPNGKTLHVPSDGRPLPGYEQALAAYKSRRANGTPNIELASAGGSSRKSGNLWSAFFGGGADEADDEADVASAAPAPRKAVKPAPAAKEATPGIAIVSPDKAQRADIPMVEDAADETPAAAPEKPETPEAIIAALPAREVPLPAFAPRPKADIGAVAVAQADTRETPEIVPFGMADASAPRPSVDVQPVQVASAAPTPDSMPFGTADASAGDPAQAVAATEQAAAANVPLPTWRPEAPAPALPQGGNQQAVLMALASADVRDNDASQALAAMPSPRPDPIKAVLDRVSTDDYRVASLSTAPRSAFSDPAGVDAASPRAVVAGRPAGSDPVAAFGGSVKTTPKENRAGAGDIKPGPKTVVVPAAPKLARWALDGDEAAAKAGQDKAAPRLAYNLVRTAPVEVYTTGFTSEDQMAQANRFTGSAVKFISVARFGK